MQNSRTVKQIRLAECEYSDNHAQYTEKRNSWTTQINVQAILKLGKCKFLFKKK